MQKLRGPMSVKDDEKPCFWCNTKRSDVPEHLSPHATFCPHYQPYVPPSIPFPISAPKSYGRIAYETYNKIVQKTVGPVPFYDWEELSPTIQVAWDGAMEVVAERVRAEQKEESK